MHLRRDGPTREPGQSKLCRRLRYKRQLSYLCTQSISEKRKLQGRRRLLTEDAIFPGLAHVFVLGNRHAVMLYSFYDNPPDSSILDGPDRKTKSDNGGEHVYVPAEKALPSSGDEEVLSQLQPQGH